MKKGIVILLCSLTGIIAFAQSPCDSNVLTPRIIYSVSVSDQVKEKYYGEVYLPEKKAIVAQFLKDIKAGLIPIYEDFASDRPIPVEKVDSFLNPQSHYDTQYDTFITLSVKPEGFRGFDFLEKWIVDVNGKLQKEILGVGLVFRHTGISAKYDTSDNFSYSSTAFYVKGDAKFSAPVKNSNTLLTSKTLINAWIFGYRDDNWDNENIEPSRRSPFVKRTVNDVYSRKKIAYQESTLENKVSWAQIVRACKKNPDKLTEPAIDWMDYGIYPYKFVDMQFGETWNFSEQGIKKTVHSYGFTYMADWEERLVISAFWVKN